jgi:tRNA (guanine-N7-)-methyltransferase
MRWFFVKSSMLLDPPRDLFPYFQTFDDLPAVLDWAELFGNDRPVELDIGCGRGMFLVNSALERPDVNILGVELDYTEARRGARRLQKRLTPNARVIGGDAREFLAKRVPPQSVSVAHVYFPDPWWKRKHKKRRLFTDEFADLLARVVRPGGEVHSWTDVEDYFAVISGLMNHHAAFERLEPPAPHEPTHDLDYHTSFHRRRSQSGAPTFRGRWRRR